MNKTFIKIIFFITLSLILLSCDSIRLKETMGDSKKPLSQSFLLTSSINMSPSGVKEFYSNKYYISNFNTINKHYVFTYSNDMNPKRVGMTEDMFPPYFKNIKYKIRVDVKMGTFKNDILCSNIIIYYNDSLSLPNQFTLDNQQKIFDCIVLLSIKDLEITF